jgi:uncharacterized membrane protein YbhN (UPF0104 family)
MAVPEEPTAPPPQGDATRARPPAARAVAALAGRVLSSRALKYGFVAVAIALGAYAVSRQWTDIHRSVGKIGIRWSLASLAFVLGALFTSMLSWRALLAGLGSRLPVPVAANVMFVGQLGKYLPGSVWPVLAQMEIATAHKVPRHRTALASVLTMGVALLTGLLLALVTLPFTGRSAPYEWTFVAAPFLVVCLYPKVLNWGFARLLTLARRPPLEQPLGARAIGVSLGWSFASWLCYGLHIWILLERVGAPAGRALPLSLGAFAFAWCAGFVVILTPAGAGVREVVLIAMLGTVLPAAGATAAAAFTVALVSRAVTAAADVVTAGIATVYSRRGRKKRPQGPRAEMPAKVGSLSGRLPGDRSPGR